jgi:hypothetical protein
MLQYIKQKVISEISAYVYECGGIYSQWYIGITSTPQIRLFMDHRVSQNTQPWIYRVCESDREARDVERYFLSLGCKGGGGGGDHTSSYVYAYKITPLTRQ